MPILAFRHGICVSNKHNPAPIRREPKLNWCGTKIILCVLYSMTGYKKKIVAFLIIVGVGSGVLVVCSAQSATDGPKSPRTKNGTQQNRNTAKAFLVRDLFASDPNFSKRSGNSSGNKELFYKMMLSVLLVVALGAAAIYVSKKLLPRITNLPGKEIRIAETVHLGPRKTVHLLKIGSQWLLIGSTSESITKLADVTDALTDLPAKEMDTMRV